MVVVVACFFAWILAATGGEFGGYIHPTVQNRVLCTFLVFGFVWWIRVEWATEISRHIPLKDYCAFYWNLFAWSALLLILRAERAKRVLVFILTQSHALQTWKKWKPNASKKLRTSMLFRHGSSCTSLPGNQYVANGWVFLPTFQMVIPKHPNTRSQLQSYEWTVQWHVLTFHLVSKDFKMFHLGSVWNSKKLVYIKLCSAL